LKRADAGAGFGRLFLANDPLHLGKAGFAEAAAIERGGTGQELVKQDAERVDIAASVDIQAAHFGLFGAHVGRRANHLAVGREERAFG
jgi:hypothetical protein